MHMGRWREMRRDDGREIISRAAGGPRRRLVEGAWKVRGRFVEGAKKVCGRFEEGARKVYGRFEEGAWKRFVGGSRKVRGRFVEGSRRLTAEVRASRPQAATGISARTCMHIGR